MAVGRRWRVREAACGQLVARLAGTVRALGLPAPELLARLLANRGVRSAEEATAFLRARLANDLRPPTLLPDASRAASRLADAIAAGETIAIHGDYDADGICAAAQLVLALRFVGVEPLLYVPDRLRDGYGLRPEAVRMLAAAGARVLVIADCGSTEREAVALAGKLGLDVIVCDHHRLPAEPPQPLALVNPLRADSCFHFQGLAASGVAFYVLMALRSELRARGVRPLPDLRRYLDLVALGTIADVMPLREENRVLVRYGLAEMERTQRPGIVALRSQAVAHGTSARAVAFGLAPRLNAGGRLGDAARAVELLTTSDPQRAAALAAELERENEERRAIEQEMLAQATEQLDAGGGAAARVTVVVARQGWHPGVVGIVAARLAQRYERPALVIAVEGKLGRGSGRSAGGIDLHAALLRCADLFDSFGGHREAAGFTLPAGRIAALAERFEAAVRSQAPEGLAATPLDIDAEVGLEDLGPLALRGLRSLEPHGPANPSPVFLVRNVSIEGAQPDRAAIVRSGSGRFWRLRVVQGSTAREVVGFRSEPAEIASLRGPWDIAVSTLHDTWQGEERSRLVLLGVRPAGTA